MTNTEMMAAVVTVYGLLGKYALERGYAGHRWRLLTEVEQATLHGYCGA